MLLSCYTVLRLPAELLVVATMIVTFAIVVVVDVAAGMAIMCLVSFIFLLELAPCFAGFKLGQPTDECCWTLQCCFQPKNGRHHCLAVQTSDPSVSRRRLGNHSVNVCSSPEFYASYTVPTSYYWICHQRGESHLACHSIINYFGVWVTLIKLC